MEERRSFWSGLATLGEGRSLFDAIVEEAPFGVYLDHPVQGCIYANRALLDQFEVSWESFAGFGWAREVLPADAERLREAIRRYEERPDRIHVTYRVRGRGELPRWIHARVHALLGADGEHLGSVGVTLDVTEQRQGREEFARAQRFEAIGRLSARVAHDFNNLLTVILGCSEQLKARVNDSAALDALRMLEDAADRSTDLSRQLLSLSRRTVPGPSLVDLDEAIRRLQGLLGRTLGEGIELALDLDAEGVAVAIDDGGLGQVLLNLAVNARDAMKGRGQVRVCTSMRGEVATVRVEDDGEGMSPEALERAFEPFFTTKELGQGTGLGLAMVRDLIDVVGGRVALESDLGRGTRVLLELPVLDRAAVKPTRSPTAERRRDDVVLLVEDEDGIRQSLGYALALRGYVVRAAADLTEARRVLAEGFPLEVLITDIMLPDGKGSDLVAELRQARPGLPVVYVSGFVGDEAVKMELDHPATSYLAKPFRPSELLECVGALLETSSASIDRSGFHGSRSERTRSAPRTAAGDEHE